MNSIVKRNSPESVPEVRQPPVEKTWLGGGIDADSRFGDLPRKVVFKVFLELLLVSHVARDIGHHDSSIADPPVPIIYAHRRFDSRLKEVLYMWMRVPEVNFGPVTLVFGSGKEVGGSHPHKSKRYPYQGYHPGDRNPEDDDEVHPKQRPALRGVRQRGN